MEFRRKLDLPGLLKKKSLFLFGPRATGKSFLIREQFKGQPVSVIDLLKSDNFLRLSANPGSLEALLGDVRETSRPRYAVIDEVQRLPALLNEVHRLIEEQQIRFLLTGSSARKLKRGQANLLGGRAWVQNIFPLTFEEIQNFSLERYLRFGGLPPVYLSEDPAEDLRAYVQTYLYEEIQAEGLVRKIPNFSRFLVSAALSNGQLINFSQIGSDSGVSPSTIREYYSILEDTLLGFALPPWTKSKNRKAIQTAKFYFFDVGVTHAITGTQHLERNSDLYGKSFEHLIGLELRAYLGYSRSFDELTYWRSVHDHEVDYLVGDHSAIEVKATRKVKDQNFDGLRALAEEKRLKKFFLVSQDPVIQKREGVLCLPFEEFLKRLWAGEIIN